MSALIDSHYHFDFLSPNIRADVLTILHNTNTRIVAQSLTPQGFFNLATDSHLTPHAAPALCAVGLHPWHISPDAQTQLTQFSAALPFTRFVGEVGLDFAPRRLEAVKGETQVHVFRQVLEQIRDAAHCRTDNAPYVVSIHAVRSAGIVTELITTLGIDTARVVPVIHRFNGTSDELTAFIRAGGYISAHPAMFETKRGRAYLSRIPQTRILLETDLPASPTTFPQDMAGDDVLTAAREAASAVTNSLHHTLATLNSLRETDMAVPIARTAAFLFGNF